MQVIKRVESWEIERSKRKHKDMFRGSSHRSTSPPSHRRISIMSTKNLHKETSTEEYNLQIGSTQLQLSHTSTQEGRHKGKHKAKKKIQVGDPMIINKNLVISKDHKWNTSHNTWS